MDPGWSTADLRQLIAVNPQRMRSQHASWSGTGTGSPPCRALCRCFCVFTSHISTHVKEHEAGPAFTLSRFHPGMAQQSPWDPLCRDPDSWSQGRGLIRNRQLGSLRTSCLDLDLRQSWFQVLSSKFCEPGAQRI